MFNHACRVGVTTDAGIMTTQVFQAGEVVDVLDNPVRLAACDDPDFRQFEMADGTLLLGIPASAVTVVPPATQRIS